MVNLLRLFLLAALMLFIQGCSDDTHKVNTYFFEDDQVWFNSHWGVKLVKGADVESFQSLSGGYGKDSKYVFFTENITEDADPDTFEVIDFHTGKDKLFIFRSGKKCKKCDKDTFTVLPHKKYKDKNFVYQGQGNGMLVVEGADPATYTVLNNWFSKDATNAFENVHKIIGADAESFKLAKCGLSEVSAEDKNRCYWFSEAVPCDCAPYSGADFPFVGMQIPTKKAHVSIVSQRKYRVEKVGDREIIAKLNAFVPVGNHEIQYSCKPEGATEIKLITTNFRFEEKRVYTIRDLERSNSECDSKIVPKTWFEGENSFIQTSIKFQSGNKTNWAVATELPTVELSAEILCRFVTKERIIEDITELVFTPIEGHLYNAYGFMNDDSKCSINLIDATSGIKLH